MDRRQQIADQRLSDQAVRSGAFGGARFGVQQAESQRNLRDVQARTAADINQRAFQQALQQAQASRCEECAGLKMSRLGAKIGFSSNP